MPDIVVRNQGVELLGSTNIGWIYPEIYDACHRDSITVELCHTRSANMIRIEFDSDRDGYIIQQPTQFSWPIEDDVCDPQWREVAFIQAWGDTDSETSQT